MDKLVMPHLGILVTKYCNLNCRDCADMIPKRKNCHYDLQAVMEDTKKIIDAVDYIEEILIIGGETLLYPKLAEVLEFCRKFDKVGRIIITSNGTIMPSDDVIKCMASNGVIARISGYPDFVAPNREQIMRKLASAGIEIHDLANMTWMSMGHCKKRYLTKEQLTAVYSSCAMKDCLTVTDGVILHCSRQMAAFEGVDYPKPEKNEIINVRTSENLRGEIESFLKAEFISTCDYCDGISCRTKKNVPTAIQIFSKKIFLELIGNYYYLLEKDSEGSDLSEETLGVIKSTLEIILSEKDRIGDVSEVGELIGLIKQGDVNVQSFRACLCKLINRLTPNYTFTTCEETDPLMCGYKENYPNLIYVSSTECEKADLIISKEDIEYQAGLKHFMDIAEYNRLFVEAKLEKIKEQSCECVVSGLSYTQYGVLEDLMKVKTANISVTGEDIPYSLMFAKKALSQSKSVKYIFVPIAYYQGYYDISSDNAPIHIHVMEKVNIPLLGNGRNYTYEYYSSGYLQMFDRFADLSECMKERDSEYIDFCKNNEFFNEMIRRPELGGLNFDFHSLSEAEKTESAKITAALNERVCTEEAYPEVIGAIEEFAKEAGEDVQVIFFVPPMTKYLFRAYTPGLKDRFYKDIYPVINSHSNFSFYDWGNHEDFTAEDFADYEHLNYLGAKKLTGLFNKVIDSLK